MLTKVKSSSPLLTDVLELPLTLEGRSDTDVLQLRDIDGLGPVKATVNTSPYGTMSGSALTGSNVADRNIVLTLGVQPNYDDWSVEKIREYAYQYFLPQTDITLTFESDERPPVAINGRVESCDPVIFSKDNQIQVSVICPDPDFVATAAITVFGFNDDVIWLTYNGTAPAGIDFSVIQASGADYSQSVELIGLGPNSFHLVTSIALVDDDKYFAMRSVPGDKYAETHDGSVIKSVLYGIQSGSIWPMFPGKGEFPFTLETDALSASQQFMMSYTERYGGL